MLPRSALTLALAVFLCPASLSAQSSQPETYGVAPAHIAHVEGAVTLEREGRPENSPLNMPLLSGDRLKTLDGRVEVLFADGSALHLDSRTTLDVQSDDLVRMIDGRLRLAIVGPARLVAYRIDSPAGSVRITQPGEYRVSLLRGQEETQLELAVIRGAGEIFTDQGSTPVRAGERAYASAGLAPSYPYTYNSANWDAFDRWSEARRDVRLGVSSQYLPEDVRPYSSTFDEYGDWRYQQTYGYVWYPRVAATWRPYYYGRWMSYPRYGWTWIGADGFAWPTHHYGRWGFSAGAWFWIPSSRWAPAYVSWAYAPGYVSWCPLGWNNRPVISINIFNVGPGYYSSARAWTLVSYSHFGRDYYVHQRAVDWNRFDRDRRPHLEIAPSAPAYRNVAVARNSTGAQRAPSNVEGRNSTPIRWAGSRDRVDLPAKAGSHTAGESRSEWLPPSGGRSAAPRYTNRGNEVIRSQTERPTSPARDASNARDGYAVQRTAPGGPARRADVAPQVSESPAREYRQPSSPMSGRVPPGYDRRPDSYAAPDMRRAQPRNDAPVYQPRATGPRADSPAPAPRSGDDPAYRPRYEPSSRQPEYARPRGGGPEAPPPTRIEGPPPSRGEGPAPSRGEGRERQAPPQRSAPPPERSAPRETAVPRNAPHGGGGGSNTAARPRGRGGL